MVSVKGLPFAGKTRNIFCLSMQYIIFLPADCKVFISLICLICRQPALEYYTQIRSLAEKLYAALSESLGLRPNELFEAVGEYTGTSMYIHYYPVCPDPSLTLGMGEHSDVVSFTILLQDEVGGLQVLKDDKWIAVKPIANALAINIGDQIEVIPIE